MASVPYSVDSAAVSWYDGTVHIRVYSTDGYTATERCWDGSGWTDGAFKQQAGLVSATSWENNGIFIRVYCTFEDTTTEWCWDAGGSGWYQGAFTN